MLENLCAAVADFIFWGSKITADGDSVQFSSVAQLCPTLCDRHELQHVRLPCSSPTPRVYPNSCPSSR